MNLSRIYEYRFLNTPDTKKNVVWKEICNWLYNGYLNKPKVVLDPAGGKCEFINNIAAEEKWAIDIEKDFISKYADKNVKIVVGNNLNVDLPDDHFDGVFISNFLEHLTTQEEVATLLEKMYKAMKKGGRIVIMGPNFRHCAADYFDYADHTVILSEGGVAEHLYGAGFNLVKIIDKFLPMSFRAGGKLPVTPFTVRTYLHMPLAWRFMGTQFLVVGEK